jgi:hypothetical protein
VRSAEALLQTSTTYGALDTKALALCGLALVDDSARLTEAATTFRAAREIMRADGIVGRVLRLFDALAMSDRTGVLDAIRPQAAGTAPDPRGLVRSTPPGIGP